MTPTELASALRDVEIANEEENYAKFQSDAAIVEEAAELIETQQARIAFYEHIMSKSKDIAFIPKEARP